MGSWNSDLLAFTREERVTFLTVFMVWTVFIISSDQLVCHKLFFMNWGVTVFVRNRYFSPINETKTNENQQFWFLLNDKHSVTIKSEANRLMCILKLFLRFARPSKAVFPKVQAAHSPHASEIYGVLVNANFLAPFLT